MSPQEGLGACSPGKGFIREIECGAICNPHTTVHETMYVHASHSAIIKRQTHVLIKQMKMLTVRLEVAGVAFKTACNYYANGLITHNQHQITYSRPPIFRNLSTSLYVHNR